METKSSKTKQLSSSNYLVVLLLITLLIVGISGLAVKSLLAAVKHDTKVHTAVAKANSKLDDDLIAAPLLVKEYQNLGTGTVKLIEDSLPTAPDFSGFLSLLESAGIDAGLTVSAVAPAQTTNLLPTASASSTTGSIELPVSVTVAGSYPQVQKMLTDLELSSRPVRVTSLQFNGSGSKLTAILNVTTYYHNKAGLPFSTEVIK